MRVRQWRSGAARSLMALAGKRDARVAMAQQVRALLEEAEVHAAPVDLPTVASFQGVRDIQKLPMHHAGRLVPLPDGGLHIQVNEAHSRGKQNFTVGHEVCHTLFPSYGARPRFVEDHVTGAYERNQEEEYLCDVGAAELIMPMALFRPMAAEQGFNLDTVARQAELFRTSREAAAIRLVQTDLWPCAMAVWHLSHKPTERPRIGHPTLPGFETSVPEKKIRLRYAVASSTFGHYLHKHLSAAPDGILARCYLQGESAYGEEQLTLGCGDQEFYVMAVVVDFLTEGNFIREVLSLLLSQGGAGAPPPFHPDLWSAPED